MDSDASDNELIEFDEDGEIDGDFGIIDFGEISNTQETPFDPTAAAPAGSKSTGVFQRFGMKKALAPYLTQPVLLQQFFDECGATLENLETQPILAPFHEIRVETDAGRKSDAIKVERKAKKDVSHERKLIRGSQTESQRRQVGVDMLNCRKRIKQAMPPFSQSNASLDYCISQAPRLNTLKYRKADHAVADFDHNQSVQFRRSLYSLYYVEDLARRVGRGSTSVAVPKELLVTVWVYRGRLPLKQREHRNMAPLLILYCLGSSSLKSVADRITCPADWNNDMAGGNSAQENFLCIDKVFLTGDVDSEYSKAKHYKEWSEATFHTDYRLESWDERTLLETQVALGAPCLYKHGAMGCEHFVVFSDVRFLHADDEHDLSLYPRVIFQNQRKWPQCAICGKKSTWQVNKSKRYPRRVNYVCDVCNSVFNFDSDDVQLEPEVELVPMRTLGMQVDNDQEVLEE